MKKTNDIHKKYPVVIQDFGNIHAVWFKRSGSFLLLEEPAFFVLQLVIEGNETAEIKKACLEKYGNAETDTHTFVDEIIQYIKQLNRKKNDNQVSKKKEAKLEPVPENLSFCRYYKFGKTVIRIDYQDEWLQHLVHPSFLHLETKVSTLIKYHICCYRTGNLFVVSQDSKIIEAFNTDAVEYYKGSISQLIYSLIYKKPFSGWMCMLHASGVYSGDNAIIFSAAAGSGKSTVSAILKANGLDYISDDFVAATPNGHVYPFPASMSVKDGAFKVLSKYYPELGEKVLEKASTGKMVRYLPVNNFSENLLNGIRVAGFIFVSYQSGSGFSIVEVSKKEALQLLLKETWVNPKPAFVKAFFDWVEKTSFYRMTYSDNDKMIIAIKNMVTNEKQNAAV
jgi:hypothetical protein